MALLGFGLVLSAARAEESQEARFVACLEALFDPSAKFEGGTEKMVEKVNARVKEVIDQVREDYPLPVDDAAIKAYPDLKEFYQLLTDLEKVKGEDPQKRKRIQELAPKLVPIMVDSNTANLSAIVNILARECKDLHKQITKESEVRSAELIKIIKGNKALSAKAAAAVEKKMGSRLLEKPKFPWGDGNKVKLQVEGFIGATISQAREVQPAEIGRHSPGRPAQPPSTEKTH